jgi:hypothetical protein
MKAADIPRIDLDKDELLAYLQQARAALGEEGYSKRECDSYLNSEDWR